VHSSFARLVVAALVASVITAGGGAVLDRLRFGGDMAAAHTRLQQEIQQRFDTMTLRLRVTADAIAREVPLIAEASARREALPALFARLDTARGPRAALDALSVYVPDGTGQYRLLAWSDGPAEDLDLRSPWLPDMPAAATAVVPGTMGLRLVALSPIGDQLGVVTAERWLTSTGRQASDTEHYRLMTSLGEVFITPVILPPGHAADATGDRLRVLAPDGRPLVDVTYDPATIAATRAAFRGRVLALALLPLLLLAVAAGTRAWLRRRQQQSSARFIALSALLATTLVLGGLGALALARAAALPATTDFVVLGLTAMGVAVALPVSLWWRGAERRSFRSEPLRASLELVGGGGVAAVLLAATGLAIDAHLQAAGIDRLASPLFPPDAARLTAHVGRLCLALAVMWSITAIHARLLERWRLHWRTPGLAVLAVTLATLPTAALSLAGLWRPVVATIAPVLLVAALTAALTALAAAPLRRRYRRASHSTRLLLLFGAAVLPALVIDPVVSVSAQRATESAIEAVHAPATLGHPAHLRDELALAMAEVDQMDRDAGIALQPDEAFRVWRATGLARGRLVSAVDLYGPSGDLISRFALNVPASGVGIDQSSAPVHCQWEVYGEVGTFGAEELRMLHAERGLCDDTGTIRGAIVLHVVFDYRALPYLSARNPYDDLLRPHDPTAGAIPWGIHTVVYGWSRLPLFASGPSAWSIDIPLLERLEQTREGFWTTRRTDVGTWRVHFLNDRAGIYALGYPVPTLFDHLTRLSETTALAALVFVLLLAGATVAAPLTQPRLAPMRALVQEVRTSFYRKLFLFFVFTAIVPVGVLALTFSAYMGDQLRSDVETEAINAVTVARRVLEDTLALQQVPVTDDVMVWIGRVINQDVNVYDGSRLRATSQRDLFDSGVLSERTPAHAYRAVVLDRVPAFVEEHRAGPFSYLVASAPVPGQGLGRQAVLSVPLAPRQQEIEREISDLNRGVLFGAVCVMLLAAGLGAWVAQRVADPVARLTRATRQIASGRLDVRIVADTADELRRLVTDFNTMAATLRDQRAELGRAHELKAWADMSRQVAHDIKNPLTPIQLAAEHLQRVHDDRGRPLGSVFDQCISTVLNQVRLLRQIASEFSNFAAHPAPTLIPVTVADLLHDVVRPYRVGLADHTRIEITVPDGLPPVLADKTLLARALTNLVENALQAMPNGGHLVLGATHDNTHVRITVTDDGLGMSADALARAFEPHFSTKTGGSGLGLANAKRNVESCGGTITATSEPGRGATMTIRLAVAAGAAHAGA
jgi:signal transduction histidine kinase